MIVYEKHDRTEPPAGRVRARVRRRLPRPHRRTLEVDADRAQGDARGRLDWNALFGREAPVVLDLGCGNGRYPIGSALTRADHDHLGIDILPVVIRYARKRGNQRGLDQPEVRRPRRPRTAGEARRAALGRRDPLLSPAAVLRPGEGPPAGSSRRRSSPSCIASLVPGGLFVIQTDNPGYWRYIREVVPVFFDFHERIGRWPDAPKGRTRREIIALQKRLPVFRGHGTAKPDLSEDEALRWPNRCRRRPSTPTAACAISTDWRELDTPNGA